MLSTYCRRRGEYYKAIGEEQIKYANHFNKYPNVPFNFQPFECLHTNHTIFEIKDFSTHVLPTNILEKYVPMGFENFKIEGRSFNIFNLLETYMYHMAKSKYRDEARFTLLLSLYNNKIIFKTKKSTYYGGFFVYV